MYGDPGRPDVAVMEHVVEYRNHLVTDAGNMGIHGSKVAGFNEAERPEVMLRLLPCPPLLAFFVLRLL